VYTKGWGRVASTRVSFSDGFGGEQESFFFFDGSHDDLEKEEDKNKTMMHVRTRYTNHVC